MQKELQAAFDLIAIDCDGTILDSGKNVAAGAHEAVAEACANGVEVTLISGRNFGSMEFIVEEVGITAPIIGGGGAFIYDVQTREVIEEHPLPLKEIRELVHLCREEKVILVLESIHDAVQERKFPHSKRVHPKHGYQHHIVPDLLKELDDPPVKAMVIGEGQNLTKVYDRIRQLGLFDSLSYSSSNSIDIVPSGVNKGSSLTALAQHLNIPLQRVAVIGDWLNDLDMFRISGFSIAMGNAPDEVKAAADLVAPINDHDGAAWAIREILKRGRPQD